jgi:hypothetical protein
VLQHLTARYDRLRPLPGRHWRLNANLRGLATLPVALTPARIGAGR